MRLCVVWAESHDVRRHGHRSAIRDGAVSRLSFVSYRIGTGGEVPVASAYVNGDDRRQASAGASFCLYEASLRG